MFFITASFVFVLDRIIKLIAIKALAPIKSVTIVKYFLYFTYTKNYGAAFGLFTGYSSFLITIGIAISAVIVFYYMKLYRREPIYALSLGLILGGSLGNLYDRIFLGHVVDYIDIRVFPVFNLADMMINLGILFLLLKVFIFEGSK